MKKLDIIAAVLVIVGGLNWGLVALFEFDLVAAIFGLEFGETNAATRIIYGLVGDLVTHRESSIVLAGDDQPPIIHAIAHMMNATLLNVGKTVFYTDPLEASSVDQTQSLRELVTDIDGGRVETLVIIGGNPAYNTPIDLRLDLNRLNKVKLRAHLSLYNNETSESCHWHINAAHYLESWSDARTYDGTVAIVQPLIAPLYEGKTAHEIIGLFGDNYDRKPYDIVRDYWQGARTSLGAGGSRQSAESSRQTADGSQLQASANNARRTQQPGAAPPALPPH